MTALRQPPGLDKAGAALWRRLIGAYELDQWELTVVEAACRQADDVARLEALLAAGGLVIAGSAGQPRLAQAVTEVRQGRLALVRLLDTLRLPADDEDVGHQGRNGRQVRTQRAAQSRWSGRHGAA
jgi:hypothetical protein